MQTEIKKSSPVSPSSAIDPTAGDGEVIYIGKGKTIRDDPKKYPERNELTGGWAGGEVGLKGWVQELSSQGAISPKAKKIEPKAPRTPKPIATGRDEIYIGFSKEDDRTGKKGRILRDDAKKYPQRDTLTGGFAGGELGLRKFVETGDIPIATGPGGVRQGQSPLVTAAIVSIAGTVGASLLNGASNVGEKVVSETTGVSPDAFAALDDNTKLLLEAAVLGLGVLGTGLAAKSIFGGVANSFKSYVTKLVTLGVFWIAVFVAAKFVIEAP